MRRHFLNILTFALLLPCAGVAALWVRGVGMLTDDVLTFRGSWSYAAGPRAKFLNVSSGDDGVRLSAFCKVVPSIGPRERCIYPMPEVPPPPEPPGPSIPGYKGTRPMNADEEAAYDAKMGAAYQARPWLRHHAFPPTPQTKRSTMPAGATFIRRLGFAGPWSFHHIAQDSDSTSPGAYLEHRVLVPYWFLMTLAGGLPAVRGAAWLWRSGRGRLARRAGRCASCGYDLRATPDRCPECGAANAGDPAAWPAACPAA